MNHETAFPPSDYLYSTKPRSPVFPFLPSLSKEGFCTATLTNFPNSADHMIQHQPHMIIHSIPFLPSIASSTNRRHTRTFKQTGHMFTPNNVPPLLACAPRSSRFRTDRGEVTPFRPRPTPPPPPSQPQDRDWTSQILFSPETHTHTHTHTARTASPRSISLAPRSYSTEQQQPPPRQAPPNGRSDPARRKPF